MKNLIKGLFKSKVQSDRAQASELPENRVLTKVAESQKIEKLDAQTLLKAKKDLRIKLILARKQINDCHRLIYGKAICERLTESQEFLNAKTIFSFLPTDEEVDLSYLEAMAFQYNKTLAYPVIGEKGVMEAYIPEYYGAFEYNRFKIREPILEKSSFLSPDRIDLVIVPMLGFDERGYRIGYGGGYYDRYLPYAVNAHVAGVCYEELKCLALPVSKHDVKLDFVMTQSNEYRF